MSKSTIGLVVAVLLIFGMAAFVFWPRDDGPSPVESAMQDPAQPTTYYVENLILPPGKVTMGECVRNAVEGIFVYEINNYAIEDRSKWDVDVTCKIMLNGSWIEYHPSP